MKKDAAKEIVFWISVFMVTLFVAKYRTQIVSKVLQQSATESTDQVLADPLDHINQNLMETHIEADAQKRQADIQSFDMQDDVSSKRVRSLDEVTSSKQDYSIRIQPENAAEEVFKQLNRNMKNSGTLTPAEELQNEMAYDEWIENYDDENRRIFFEKIQQHAKEQGLKVEFDSEYRIKSVKRIRKKRLMSF